MWNLNFAPASLHTTYLRPDLCSSLIEENIIFFLAVDKPWNIIFSSVITVLTYFLTLGSLTRAYIFWPSDILWSSIWILGVEFANALNWSVILFTLVWLIIFCIFQDLNFLFFYPRKKLQVPRFQLVRILTRLRRHHI